MTIASLGLAVDSSQVASATPALQKMAAAAGGAEAAARSLGSGAQAAASGVRSLDAANDSGAASAQAAAAASRVHAAALQAEAAAARMASFQTRNLMFQLNDVGVSLASGMNPLMVLIQQGSQIATIWGPDEGGVGRAFRETGNLIGGFVTKFAPIAIAVGAVTAGFAGLTYEINKTAETQVGFGDVFMATVQLAAEGIGNLLRPAIAQVGTWMAQLWDLISPTLKTIGNAIVGTFVFAFDAVKVTWGMFPAALGDLVIQGVNGVIAAVEGMINKISESINGFIRQVNGAIQMIPEGLRGGWQGMGEIGPVGFGRVDNPNAGYADEYATELGVAGAAFDVDYMGQAMDAIAGRAQKLQLEQMAEDAEKAAKGLKAANDNGRAFEKMLSDVSPLLQDANDPLRDLQANMDKLGALLAAGEISWEQYGNAVNKANLSAASGVLGAVGQITGALAGAFENNKAFAVANAVINTAEGVTKALAQGGIFGFASAAAIGISGAAQIASIMSAQPGSSSTTPVNAAAAAPVVQPQAAGINLTIRGSGSISVDELAQQLTKSIADGGNQPLINIIRERAA